MIQQRSSTYFLGIADSAWPASAPIEQIAIEVGFEVMVSSQMAGLIACKDRLGMVVTHLPREGSVQDAMELMKEFTDSVQFIIRVDKNDYQTAATLAKVPGVQVVSDSDFSRATWKQIFDQFFCHKQKESVVEKTSASQLREYIFVDPRSQHLLALVERLAVTKATVLLQGSTGTGKEVLAKTLHELSDRASKPFIALNCAAMPEHLVEDMLFGHERGAFTGANKELAGIFEQAHGGTVFLDEIGDMPIQLQSKLLRVLQEREVVRLGGHESIKLDFRLVAASNKELKVGIQDKTFREDLYYRISAFKLQVPTLAERRGDIVPLANSLAVKHGIINPKFSEGALRQLYGYQWPGNVRELDNVIQRAVVFADYGQIDSEHIFFDDPIGRSPTDLNSTLARNVFDRPIRAVAQTEPVSMSFVKPHDLQSAVRASEQDVIIEAIRTTRTREEAARKLGISPRTLRYKMAKFRENGSNIMHCA